MTDRERAFQISGQASGVIAALYGVVRDISAIGIQVDEEKNGKLGDVVGDVFDQLAELPELVPDGSGEENGCTCEDCLEEDNSYQDALDALRTINRYIYDHPETELSVRGTHSNGARHYIFSA